MKEQIIKMIMRKDASIAARLMVVFENIDDNTNDINRCFRKMIAGSDVDTINCRKYLEDDLPEEEWLSQIETYVVPHLIKYKLPRNFNE